MKNKVLLILNAFFSALILLHVVFFRTKTSLPAEQTSLLNKKYIELIDTILIDDPASGASLTLTNVLLNNQTDSKTWIGKTEEGLIFPVRISISQMLGIFSSTIKVQNISHSYESWNAYGLKPEQALSLTFTNSQSMEVFSKIFFGSENFNGQTIFFRTEKAPVYQTKNIFYQYLNASLTWCDTSLLPSYTGITESTVQRIIITCNDGLKKIFTPDESSSYAGRLIQSTGKPVINTINTAELVLTVSIENGDTSDYTLNVYYEREKDLYYIVNSSFFKYALEISEWTYNRLTDPFNK